MMQTDNRTHLVFVYGTLRRGGYNHRYLQETQCLGACRSAPAFTMLDLGPFPGVVRGGTTAIKGEVYCVDEAGLASLDELEGYPVDYTRERTDTPFGRAWIYLFRAPADDAPMISGGDWCVHRGE